MKISNSQFIKRIATIFLQIIIVLIGIAELAALLWEPHSEGRNVHASFAQIYFHDPFLTFIYLVSIPFFVALYQAFKVLGYVRHNKIFSLAAVKMLKVIKYCAFIIAGSTVAADMYLKIAARSSHDDPTGAIMLGVVITFVAIVVAAASAVFEKILQHAVDIQSENDLTV